MYIIITNDAYKQLLYIEPTYEISFSENTLELGYQVVLMSEFKL